MSTLHDDRVYDCDADRGCPCVGDCTPANCLQQFSEKMGVTTSLAEWCIEQLDEVEKIEETSQKGQKDG